MAATAGDADSAWPTPCEGHGNTQDCPKCMYRKYQPEQVFQKILSPADVQRKGSYRLYLPKQHAPRFCPPANGSELIVYDVHMKRWPMRFLTKGEQAYLTRGWTRFAQAKELSEGDTVTIYELNCKRGTGTRVFMIGVSRKGCLQILGAPIRN